MTRKLLSILVAVIMVMALVPIGALAAGHAAAETANVSEFAKKSERNPRTAANTDEYVKTFRAPERTAAETERDNVITSVEVTGFAAPEWGAAINTAAYAVPDGAHYSIHEANWAYWGSRATWLNEGDLFNNDKVYYYCSIEIVPDDGYTFADDVNILINGSTQYVDPAYSGYDADYEMFFVCTIDFTVDNPNPPDEEHTITKIEVNGFVEPAWKAYADTSVLTVPAGAHYSIDPNYTLWFWYYGWDSGYLENDDVFDDDSVYYYLQVAIVPEDGYTFDENAEFLINGSDEFIDESGYAATYGLFYAITDNFTVVNPNAILTVEVNYNDPVWGGTIEDTEVSIPEDADYEILEYYWEWEEGEDYDDLYEDELFDSETRRYYLYIALAPLGEHDFSGYTTALVNGDPYIADPDYTGYYSDYHVFVINTMYYTVTDPDTTVAVFDFDTDPLAEGWKFIDKDNDHVTDCNWYWFNYPDSSSYFYSYQGKGLITSASWASGYGALEPDNWAISPAVTGATEMSFYVSASSAYWCEEHFAVYAGTAPRPDQMTEVFAETEATGEYVRYEVDLSEFAGQTIYIGFRHFNCVDNYRLEIDHVVLSRPVVWGDADCDAQLTAADSLLIMRLVQGIITEDDIDVRFLDVNADGKIDLVDALLVLRKVMGIFTDPFPAEASVDPEPKGV
ncbi:MAG: choice-of-anchor J domain-containing protein [Clostridia bacterium]|nr:choice-of-anchor J domain-containing protein [Clostridia bacterium]